MIALRPNASADLVTQRGYAPFVQHLSVRSSFALPELTGIHSP